MPGARSDQERQEAPGQVVGDFLGNPVPAGHDCAGDVLGLGGYLVRNRPPEAAFSAEREYRHGQQDVAVTDVIGHVTMGCPEIPEGGVGVAGLSEMGGVLGDGPTPGCLPTRQSKHTCQRVS
jgi:hypothetical protein